MDATLFTGYTISQPTIFEIKHYPPGFVFGPHAHNEIEINSVIKGRCAMRFGHDTVYFAPGDTMIVFPGTAHFFYVERQKASLVQLEFALKPDTNTQPKGEIAFFEDIHTSSGQYIKVSGNSRLGNTILALVEELNESRLHRDALLKVYYQELFLLISRQIDQANRLVPLDISPVLVKALEFMRLNMCNEIRIQSLAAEFSMSERYFRTLFHRHLGVSPTEYLSRMRIGHARELLNDKTLTIKEIAYQCGFSSPEYFARRFRQLLGHAPEEYRKALFRKVHPVV